MSLSVTENYRKIQRKISGKLVEKNIKIFNKLLDKWKNIVYNKYIINKVIQHNIINNKGVQHYETESNKLIN